ncbi:unnamed protein product [Linum tenue]|uniref:Uncharacterized protein n=1 Tax=Linum tenue TaxID=586396 RepID=A0AAV0HBY9_9ROSI|nr:unnamed protein product [Linum tenue]
MGRSKSGGSFWGNLFRGGRRSSSSYGDYGAAEEYGGGGGRRVWASDEDKAGKWVADPRIDTKASAFIAHFHASRISEAEHMIFLAANPPPPPPS